MSSKKDVLNFIHSKILIETKNTAMHLFEKYFNLHISFASIYFYEYINYENNKGIEGIVQ